MTRRILLIEDNRDYAEILRLHLADQGWEVGLAADGPSGLAAAEQGGFDLVILDLMLPELEGLEVCRRLRAQKNYTPIVMLTAKATELDRVLGLETGADDYLVKPCSVNELLARVRALFRRMEMLAAPEPEAPQRLERAGIAIDAEKRKVTVAGQGVELTAREFDLLLHFMRHPGRVFSRAELLDLVWGYGHEGYEHTVNTHINRLRAKVEADPSKPRHILTVWGVGYKFSEEGEGSGEGVPEDKAEGRA